MNDWKQQMKTRLTPIAEVFLGKGGLERKPLLRPVQPRPIAQMMKDLRALEESVFIQPQRMADALLRSALVRGGGSPRDDMTVLVLLLVDRQHAA